MDYTDEYLEGLGRELVTERELTREEAIYYGKLWIGYPFY